MSKVIITAAITGSIHTPTMSPYLPITPEEIADEAVRANDAGAAVAHIHVRNPDTGQNIADMNLFREVAARVKSKCDMILCFTTGGGIGQTVAQRVMAVHEFKPELASLNFGSMNFALFHALDAYKNFKFSWEEEFLRTTDDFIFPNTFKTLREFCGIFNENMTKPEIEIYDIGMLNNVNFMLKKDYLKKPVYLQFVMGILGGIQPTIDNLVFLRNSSKDLFGDFIWSVCAAGRHQMNMCTISLTMGGNVRVGLEDNLYLEKGIMAKSNAEQVEKIARIARELGREPATPAEARQILGLKGLEKVNY